jgi:hypothetical protein
MRPTLASPPTNHMLPSGPATMPRGSGATPDEKFVTVEPGPTRPIACAPSANQIWPSGPVATPAGSALAAIPAISLEFPDTSRWTMFLLLNSVNHRASSGPAAMPSGPAPGVMPVLNSVIVPAGVIRATLSLADSVNQRLPSGPEAMCERYAAGERLTEKRVIVPPDGDMRAILFVPLSTHHSLPSGPVVIPRGSDPATRLKSVMAPFGEM